MVSFRLSQLVLFLRCQYTCSHELLFFALYSKDSYVRLLSQRVHNREVFEGVTIMDDKKLTFRFVP